MKLQGLNFHIMQRKGKCQQCKRDLVKGDKSVLIGSCTNIYRYCTDCFALAITFEMLNEIT